MNEEDLKNASAKVSMMHQETKKKLDRIANSYKTVTIDNLNSKDSSQETPHKSLISKEGFMAGWTGIEPATSGLTGQRSNQAELPPHERQ